MSHKNNLIVDDDALSINNLDCKKYVLYLYSLDPEQFKKFQKYLSTTASNCSVRLGNAIRWVGFQNFLVNYFFADEIKLFKIKNFGKKTLLDFNSIKPQIKNFIEKEYNWSKLKSIETETQLEGNNKYESLTLKERVGEQQYVLLTNLLKTLLSNASVRTQNGINNYKGDFIEDFVHKSNDVKLIRHIGRKSEIEINAIISQLREICVNFVQHNLAEDDIFWIEKSSVYGTLIDGYCHDYYKINGRIPMFHLLANCISSLLKVRSVKILDEVVSLFSDKGGNELEIVANKHNISRERIRQICIEAITILSEKQNPEDSNIDTYHKLICQDEDWAYISQILSKKTIWKIGEFEGMFRQEECSLKKEFVLFVLSVIFSDHYSIIGKSPLSINSRGNRWSNTYLISKKITDSFDFNVMIDIVKNFENKNTESSNFTIQELLMDTFFDAWKQYDYSIEEDLKYIVGHILVDELGIIPDLDFNYTIKGKKEESPADIIYNLLVDSGKPLTLNILLSQMNTVLSKGYRSADSLRHIVDKDPRLCFVGYNREVSLSEWSHIQIGNIRELIVEYLDNHNVPQHIDDIVVHVQKYRNTSKNSINSTMCSGDQFVKFEGGYYGLSERSYSKEYRLADSKRSASERLSDFNLFIRNNKRFPFSQSEVNSEESLYLWWQRNKSDRSSNDELRLKILEIESLYSDLPKNKSDYKWLCDCQKYKDFVLQKGRRPSRKNGEESELENWFSSALSEISDGKLSEFKEKEFIKLCNSL